jgi:hypothetical protein
MAQVGQIVSAMTTADWIALATAIVTAGGVFIAILALRSEIRGVKEQLSLQHFADYTKRYQEIIVHFPEDINEAAFDLRNRRDDYDRTMRYMRAYFDLCFEEWYMRTRLDDPGLWSVWSGGMKAAFSKIAFQDAWSIVRSDTAFGDEFEAFVNSLIAESKSRPSPIKK